MKYKRKKSYWQQDIRKIEYAKAFLQGLAVILTISYLFYGNLLYAILISPYLIWYIKSWETHTIKKRKEKFRLQFKEAIQTLAAGLNVGYSVENAMNEAVKELKKVYKKDDILVKELSYMIRQLQMNVSAENALKEFSMRMEDEDVQTFVSAFAMAKRSGGDSMEIIRNVVRQMGEKIDVEREVQTLMAGKRLELRVMTIIPLGMIAYLKIGFPEFLDILYGNVVGVIIMSICLAIYAISYAVGKRMVEIEV